MLRTIQLIGKIYVILQDGNKSKDFYTFNLLIN